MMALFSVDDCGDLLRLGPVERARAVALVAHAGQVDKAGVPYISHPFRVHVLALGLAGFAALSAEPSAQDSASPRASERLMAEAAAYLHDAVEDTALSLEDVAALFPDVPDVVSVIDALTHRPHEPRVDYYARVKANRVALVVKEADLLDNTDYERRAALPAEDASRLGRKYAQAFKALALPLPQHLDMYA